MFIVLAKRGNKYSNTLYMELNNEYEVKVSVFSRPIVWPRSLIIFFSNFSALYWLPWLSLAYHWSSCWQTQIIDSKGNQKPRFKARYWKLSYSCTEEAIANTWSIRNCWEANCSIISWSPKMWLHIKRLWIWMRYGWEYSQIKGDSLHFIFIV